MKLSANESLHSTDYEMVTEIFSAALPPAEAPKVRVMTSLELWGLLSEVKQPKNFCHIPFRDLVNASFRFH